MNDHIYKIEYDISLEDFREFNSKIAIKSTLKTQKKARLMGIIEIFFALFYIVASLFTNTLKIDGFFILSMVLIFMGLFSCFYYPLFFKKKLDRAISKIYNEVSYFKSSLCLVFFNDYCYEVVKDIDKDSDNIEKKFYSSFIDIEETDSIVAILSNQTSGFIIPKRCIDKEIYDDFLAFLHSKVTKEKV